MFNQRTFPLRNVISRELQQSFFFFSRFEYFSKTTRLARFSMRNFNGLSTVTPGFLHRNERKIKSVPKYSEELAIFQNHRRFSADQGRDAACDVITTHLRPKPSSTDSRASNVSAAKRSHLPQTLPHVN